MRTLLVHTLTGMLERRDCTSVCVVAAPDEVEAYGALGFEAESPLLRFAGGRPSAFTTDHVLHWDPRHLLGIFHLDRLATGGDRRALLAEHTYLGNVYAERGRVRGFLMPLLGEGLVVAEHWEAGLELLRWLLPLGNGAVVEAHSEIAEQFRRWGCTERPADLRMRWGQATSARPGMVFAGANGILG